MSIAGRIPMSWARPIATAAVVALACALAAAGCSADERPPPVPSGFTSYHGDGYRFAYPAGWAVRRRTDEQMHKTVLIDDPEISPEGLWRGQIRVGREEPARVSFADQLNQYRAMSMLQGRQVRVDRKVRIPGARLAHRFEAVYSIQPAKDESAQPAHDQSAQPAEDGSVAPAEGRSIRLEVIDLYVLTEDNALLNFVVRAPDGGIVTTRLQETLASFRVTRA
jgi:hypothetical protein